MSYSTLSEAIVCIKTHAVVVGRSIPFKLAFGNIYTSVQCSSREDVHNFYIIGTRTCTIDILLERGPRENSPQQPKSTHNPDHCELTKLPGPFNLSGTTFESQTSEQSLSSHIRCQPVLSGHDHCLSLIGHSYEEAALQSLAVPLQ